MRVSSVWRDTIFAFFRTPVAIVVLAINMVFAALNTLYFEENTVSTILFIQSLANILFQLVITRHILGQMGIIQPIGAQGQRGFGSALLLLLLSGLAILAGIVLLVIPGILLLLRWSVALPIMVSTHSETYSSLGQSWDMTEPHMAKLLLAFAPIIAAYGGYAATIYVFEDAKIIMLADMLIEIFIIYGWILPCCIFQHLRTDDRQIFA